MLGLRVSWLPHLRKSAGMGKASSDLQKEFSSYEAFLMRVHLDQPYCPLVLKPLWLAELFLTSHGSSFMDSF